MRILGLIVEYNPMHYGHIYHLEESKALIKPDVVVAVMSSHVVQRGEFSCVDKFTKTTWALKAGIDLVVELPGVFSLQSADIFARTSVETLNHLGVTDIVFGSETGSIEPLKTSAEMMRTSLFDARVKTYLAEGHSYPSSTDLALSDFMEGSAHKAPNDILGIQYLQSIYRINPNIKAHVIKRQGAGYHDDLKKDQQIQSASALRSLYKTSNDILAYVPDYVHENLTFMVDLSAYESHILYLIRTLTAEQLHQLFSFDAGLEHLFLSAEEAKSLDELYQKLTSKRYTLAKIKRALMHMLLNIHKKTLTTFKVPYVRILGMNDKGQTLLNTIKHDIEVPLITKLKRTRHPYLDIELRITRIFDLIHPDDNYAKEFLPVLIL